MSDSDPFTNNLSGVGGFEIPARAAMYNRLMTLYNKFEHSINPLSKPTNEQEAKYSILSFLEHNPVPVSIGEVDAVQFYSISLPEDPKDTTPLKDCNYLVIDMALYKDKSPYVPDELISKRVDSNDYWLVISDRPEEPPFIMNFDDKNNEAKALGVNDITIEDYKRLKSEKGEKLIYPNDQECAAIVEAISKLAIDVMKTETQNS